LRNEDPHVTFLGLCLVDNLVKNTTYYFHTCVATQPIMSTIARVARGSAHTTKMYTGNLRRDSKHMWQMISEKVGNATNANTSHSELLGRERARERERNVHVASRKAKEVIKSWGEGFVETKSSLPLFGSTYQTLINEGINLSEINIEGAVILDAPDEFTRAASNSDAPDITELSNSAHQTAKILTEICESADPNEDDDGLRAIIVDQVHAQQAQLASHIEIAMGTNNEPQLISALAANEALQDALACAQGKKQTGHSSPAVAAKSDFESTMQDVDSSLVGGDDINSGPPSVPSQHDQTEDLLGMDFLTPAAAPAPAILPSSASSSAVPATSAMSSVVPLQAAPSGFPTAAPTLVAAAAPPISPAPGPSTVTSSEKICDSEIEDEFVGLALQRKQKGQHSLALP